MPGARDDPEWMAPPAPRASDDFGARLAARVRYLFEVIPVSFVEDKRARGEALLRVLEIILDPQPSTRGQIHRALADLMDAA